MDYLRDLTLFIAVAEARNFSRAAARLAMPTSTLSRRIAGLEASLGVKLLNRTTRIVELTEAGALYFAHCERIVEAARAAHEQVRGAVETSRGLLRMSIEAETGWRIVAPVIAEYLERYPAVRIDMDLSPRRVDLLSEGFDLAVRLGTLPDSTLTVRRLALLGASLYAAPEYLARHGEPAHPVELRHHRRVHLLHTGDDGQWRLFRGTETIEIGAGSIVSANNMTMIWQLARLGVGVAAVDDLMARDDVAAGALCPILAGWTLTPVPISVVTPGRAVPAKTRLFVDMLAGRVTGAVGLRA